ncbi:T-cell surface antigen CD2 isoform X3 [Oryzias melastigma]|uniref:T-cell surface antigen CD2 isoform X3 n=1 Tax=Oryzias melastigma TaxID=30732 RepID=UPI000CF809CA|nr:T-cell surface antigen CD2 isoform X3 [Oryzias melastigma]
MTAVIGLLLMLLTVTDGVVTHCDGRQNGAQCYGALGGSVSIQLMDDFSKIHRYQLFKQNTIVMSGGKDKQPDSIINNRYSFIPSNWTFWINNLSRNDSDEYKLGTFDTNGKQTAIHSLQLSVQAPVSSVSLVSECLSQGEMKVSCSSEGGDSPQYRWTLNGKSLTEAELLSGNEQTNIITLKQHVSGRLVCSVWNHVSSVSNETNIRTCGFIYINCTFNGTEISKWVFKESNTLCLSPTTVSPTEHSSPAHLPILGGVLSALLFFLLVGIVIICKRKKKPIVKAERGEHELIYADVRVVKQQSKKQKQRPCQDADVEYGQVKFRERPQHTETPADECVYAKVRK